jgi:hypothetical protein
MGKAVDNSTKEVEKWTVEVSKYKDFIDSTESEIDKIREGLGKLVIEGGDVDKSMDKVFSLDKKMAAYQSGYKLAQERLVIAQEALKVAEKNEATNRINRLFEEVDQVMDDYIGLYEHIHKVATDISDKVVEIHTLKRAFDIHISNPYEASSWRSKVENYRGHIEYYKKSRGKVGIY